MCANGRPLAYVNARAEFLWDGWVQHEHRWELVPLVATAWQWMPQARRSRGCLSGEPGVSAPFGTSGILRKLNHFMRRALAAVDEQSFGPNHPNVATLPQ